MLLVSCLNILRLLFFLLLGPSHSCTHNYSYPWTSCILYSLIFFLLGPLVLHPHIHTPCTAQHKKCCIFCHKLFNIIVITYMPKIHHPLQIQQYNSIYSKQITCLLHEISLLLSNWPSSRQFTVIILLMFCCCHLWCETDSLSYLSNPHFNQAPSSHTYISTDINRRSRLCRQTFPIRIPNKINE